MNLTAFYKSLINKIYILRPVQDHPVTNHVLSILNNTPAKIITRKEEIPDKDLNPHTLLLNAPASRILGRCPGSKGHICCNYITVDLYVGCTIGCTYCILQDYLNFSPIIVNVDIEAAIQKIIHMATGHPDAVFRIGTGEVGDSLLFDPLFRLSEPFIRSLAPYPNVFFELKTKTGFINHLLDLEQKGQAVIGFSLNPQPVIDTEEGTAASLEQRLAAARKAAAAGYGLAFHCDPVFHFKGWEDMYFQVIDRLKSLPEDSVRWISLGTFRYLPALADKIKPRWYLYDEFVFCRDKKYRYLQQIRTAIYRKMVNRIRNIFPRAPVYLCMESSAVWERVFQKKPGKIPTLCAIFNRVNVLSCNI